MRSSSNHACTMSSGDVLLLPPVILCPMVTQLRPDRTHVEARQIAPLVPREVLTNAPHLWHILIKQALSCHRDVPTYDPLLPRQSSGNIQGPRSHFVCEGPDLARVQCSCRQWHY